MYKYFKKIGNTDYISEWKSKQFSDEIIKPATTSDHIGNKTRDKFAGSCLKQDKITFTHGKKVNIYIVYEIYVFLILITNILL